MCDSTQDGYTSLALLLAVAVHKLLVTHASKLLASSPGHSQILSCSRGEKSGEGLGSKLRHGPENRVHHLRSISGLWCSFAPRPSPDFSPWLQDKIWKWPGDEATKLLCWKKVGEIALQGTFNFKFWVHNAGQCFPVPISCTFCMLESWCLSNCVKYLRMALSNRIWVWVLLPVTMFPVVRSAGV